LVLSYIVAAIITLISPLAQAKAKQLFPAHMLFTLTLPLMVNSLVGKVKV
jgi:hypothetical protein